MAEQDGTPTLVELAQRTVEATNDGDFETLQKLYAPNAVWRAPGADLVEERFEGSAAIRRFLEGWFGSVHDLELEAREIRDLGSGVVFSRFVQRGRPLGSTASIEFHFATFSIWDGGLILENAGYTDIDEARAAAERLAAERG